MVNLWSQLVLMVLYLLLLTVSSLNFVSCYGSKKFMKGLVIGHMLGMKKSHFAHYPHYPHYPHPPIIPAVMPPAIAPPVAVATPTSFALPMTGTSAFSINAGMTTGFGLPGTALAGGISPFAMVNPALVSPAINPFGALNGLSINPFALGTAIAPFAASTTGIAPAANIFVTG